MARVRRKYQSNAGGIYRISLDAAKAGVASNAEPAGALTDPLVEVEVSEAGNRRKGGIHPRGVRFTRVGTGADLNKVFSVFIPCLTEAALGTISVLATLDYKGQTYSNPTIIPES